MFDPKLDVSRESFLRIYEILTIKPEIRRAKLNWAGIRGKQKFGFSFRVKCMLFHSPLEIFGNLVNCKTTKDWNLFRVVVKSNSVCCVLSCRFRRKIEKMVYSDYFALKS